MNTSLKILALVPARGGSKGIPLKNIQKIGGHPLVGFPSALARQSGIFSDVIITTDSVEIAQAATQYGAEAPFMRPSELANDGAPMIDTIIHAVDELTRKNREYTHCCLLQPTSPFRNPTDITNAVAQLNADSTATSITAVSFIEDAHPRRLRRIVDGALQPFDPNFTDNERQQRQNHYNDRVYRKCGSFYIFKLSTLKGYNSIYGPRSLAYIIESPLDVTIDTPLDLLLAHTVWDNRASFSAMSQIDKILSAITPSGMRS